ncbi:hypothetical protein [Parabacteroides faecis]|uniref:Anti-sigma factor n=1 Tax=Parabacteroides faecis TaxID=1217282 RepID=A0ABR6KR26_9BACT|nr:hypothetical protein [Parabacteroides faecis]MBB4623234.1 hypothetical protein [Parabacteroides faecis]GGJ99284.1 hypothetical protein GCM10007084_23380 [Parabacteroides faecis]
MQTEKQKHIEELLERFFDGETSNTEEQELYSFFNSPEVPEALESYRSVFGYFETGIKEEFHEKIVENERSFPWKSVKKWLWVGISVAASILLFLVYTFRTEQPDPFNPYEGSYIVRNGVRITNMDEILPELEYTVREVEDRQEQAEQIAGYLSRKEKQLREQEINATNPYRKILEDNPNKYFRQEMKTILYSEYK